jgi:hypothetical protein
MELRSERKMEKAASKAHRLPYLYSQVVTAIPQSAFRARRTGRWASTAEARAKRAKLPKQRLIRLLPP